MNRFVTLEISIEDAKVIEKIINERIGKDVIARELTLKEKLAITKARDSIEIQIQ